MRTRSGSFLILLLLAACGSDPISSQQPQVSQEAGHDFDSDHQDAMVGRVEDAGAGDDDATADSPTVVRVMTWNVENFFDDVDDTKKEDTVLSAAEVSAKIDALREVIRSQDPDVVALQEVENKALLQRLGDQVNLPNVELVTSYDYRGINVAIATKFPIAKTVSHLGEKFYAPDGRGPYRWARDCLEVHLTTPKGTELVMLVNHQTSQLDSSAGDAKRQAQANRTREIADQLRTDDPVRPVIIVGDMNDLPTAPSIHLLHIGGSFVDIANDVPEAERYTYVYNGKKRYDYILPDSDTAQRRLNVAIPHTPEVKAASDHAPIVATFGW